MLLLFVFFLEVFAPSLQLYFTFLAAAAVVAAAAVE
jgi:hypothetical protein